MRGVAANNGIRLPTTVKVTIMSLDVYLNAVRMTQVYTRNVTHNLVPMAKEAGIYQHLWRPAELGITKASELIEPLAKGLTLMKLDPERFKKHNPENGWGDYDGFVNFVETYLRACEANPDATVEVSI